ncbi:MAG: hypothetical protein HOY79_35050 [Streptomyces sp.]|nr:hypothetical protein [Streptomyces sp.]
MPQAESSQEEHPFWRVKHGDDVVGYLYPRGADQPWVMCRFEPADAWTDLQSLFAAQEEARRLRFPPDKVWAVKAIKDLDLNLERVDDGTVTKPTLLYIEGTKAQFRA